MSGEAIARRAFLEGAGLAAFSAAALAVQSRAAGRQIAVPNSTGTESPALEAPVLSGRGTRLETTTRRPARAGAPDPRAGSLPGPAGGSAETAQMRLLLLRA